MSIERTVKSLRWLVLNFPRTKNPKDDTDRLSNCISVYCQNAIYELKRLQEHNDSLQETNTALLNEIIDAKSETIKEFAERYEKAVLPLLTSATLDKKDGIYACLDILKEMVGDDNGES